MSGRGYSFVTRPCARCGRDRPAFMPCEACAETLANDALAQLVSQSRPELSQICDCGQLRFRCGHPEVLK